jgi:hypothetical protein
MAARKKNSSSSGMKALGNFYSGKTGGGSADTMSARGSSRRSSTYQWAGSEGSKAKKTASSSATKPKTKTSLGSRPDVATRSKSAGKPTVKRTSSSRTTSTGSTVAKGAGALIAIGAAGAGAKVAGSAMGRAAFRGATVTGADGGQIFRLDEPTRMSQTIRSQGRDAWGQRISGNYGIGGIGGRGGVRLQGK